MHIFALARFRFFSHHPKLLSNFGCAYRYMSPSMCQRPSVGKMVSRSVGARWGIWSTLGSRLARRGFSSFLRVPCSRILWMVLEKKSLCEVWPCMFVVRIAWAAFVWFCYWVTRYCEEFQDCAYCPQESSSHFFVATSWLRLCKCLVWGGWASTRHVRVYLQHSGHIELHVRHQSA